MATGEKTFSTGSVEKTKRNFDPVPAGDYDMKLLKQVEIRTAEPKKIEKGKFKGQMSKPVPRVSLRFEILESGQDGAKNKLYFHDLTCNMTPDSGGVIPPTGADQLKGLADALGVEAEVGFVMYTPKGSTDKVKIIDPRALKAWCEQQADQVVRGHLKVQAGTKDYPESKNKLTEFFDAGSGSTEGGEDGGGIEDGGEEGGDSEDASLDELPDMDEKPSKPAAKPAAKGKPANKKR